MNLLWFYWRRAKLEKMWKLIKYASSNCVFCTIEVYIKSFYSKIELIYFEHKNILLLYPLLSTSTHTHARHGFIVKAGINFCLLKNIYIFFYHYKRCAHKPNTYNSIWSVGREWFRSLELFPYMKHYTHSLTHGYWICYDNFWGNYHSMWFWFHRLRRDSGLCYYHYLRCWSM